MADLSPTGARRIYRIMCNVAACDGLIHPTERLVLEDAAKRFEIEAGEAKTLEADGVGGAGMDVGECESERATLITCMIDVAAADGRLDKAERKLLVQVARDIGLSREDLVEQIIPRMTGEPTG